MEARTIAIIGGGFAGTALIRALDGKLPRVIGCWSSARKATRRQPDAAGGGRRLYFPEQVVAPIREMIAHARFVMGRVTQVDPAQGSYRIDAGGRNHLSVRASLLALGNRARLDLIPGLEQHALPLKTVGDAMHIRNIVLRRVARDRAGKRSGCTAARPLRHHRRRFFRSRDGWRVDRQLAHIAATIPG